MMKPLSQPFALIGTLVLFGGMLSCAKGVEAPLPTTEVYILDGLVVEYGAETPCYGKDGIEQHTIRCKGGAKPLKPAYPVVQLRLKPFAFDQHEVTNRQYRHCVAMGKCQAPWYTDSFDQGIDYYLNTQYDDYPVHQVTWTMAQAYCDYHGRELPTSAQWQRVAQGSPVHGTHRAFPAEGITTLESCQDSNANIGAEACDGRREFARALSPGGDLVNEGYTAKLEPAQVYHMFSNVSEFTADEYQEDITCKGDLPTTGDYAGGDYPGWVDCIDCGECTQYTGIDKIECDQECKICEACAGTYGPKDQPNTEKKPYRPEHYGCPKDETTDELVCGPGDVEVGPLDCQIDCWGESRESPICTRYSVAEQPLAVGSLISEGADVIVLGGHVGIANNSGDLCRYRADYREERLRPDGSADTQNLGTGKGIGFRCARPLEQNELVALAQEAANNAEWEGRFDHLKMPADQAAPEASEVTQPNFTMDVAVAPPLADAASDEPDTPTTQDNANDVGPSEGDAPPAPSDAVVQEDVAVPAGDAPLHPTDGDTSKSDVETDAAD